MAYWEFIVQPSLPCMYGGPYLSADTNQSGDGRQAESENASTSRDDQAHPSQREPTHDAAGQQPNEGGSHVQMPDIEPAGRVQMVEVEVEHHQDGGDTPTSPTQHEDTPTSPTSPTSPSENEQVVPRLEATPQTTPPQTTPPQTMPPATAGSQVQPRGLPVGAQSYASAYDARPMKGKGKTNKSPLSRDLMPLNRDVARSTQSLVEPVATPDFKPTPEWVSMVWGYGYKVIGVGLLV